MKKYKNIFLFGDKVKRQNIPEEFIPIYNLFFQDCGQGKVNEFKIDMNRVFINGDNGSTDKNELMLRLNTFTNTLVVARIEFINKRRGYMTKLQDLLNDFGIKNGFKYIEIESVLTNEMLSFIKKKGYKEIKYNPMCFYREIK